MSGSKTRGAGGAVVAILFFAVFAAMGTFFAVLLVQQTLRTAETHTWEDVPCVIEGSAVDLSGMEDASDDSPYRLEVSYRYSIDGAAYRSTTYREGYTGEDSIADAEALQRRYAPGSRHTCHVDPESPGDAVLERNSLWTALFLLLPGVFMLIGYGGIFLMVRSLFWSRREAKGGGVEAISSKARKKGGVRGVMVLAGVLMVGGGVAASVFWSIPLLTRAMASGNWPSVGCTILSSRVGEHDSDDGTTYSVDIVYQYTVDGRSYRSDRYSLMGGSSSGYKPKRRIVDAYPKGAARTCYYDPDDPAMAVLAPGFRAIYLLGLLPLAVVAGGVVLGVAVLRKSSGGAVEGKGNDGGRASGLVQHAGGPGDALELKPRTGRLARVIGFFFIALFWNGIISIFVLQAIEGFREADADWFLTLFMVPFVLIGLVLVAGFIHALLKLANPTVTLRLQPGRPVIGSAFRLEWSVRGAASRISRLSIHLEGREEAHYRVGTNNRVEHSVFHRSELASVTSPLDVRSGSVEGFLPGETVPSLDLEHNKIVWRIRLKGGIEGWPDVSDEYPVEVQPLETA